MLGRKGTCQNKFGCCSGQGAFKQCSVHGRFWGCRTDWWRLTSCKGKHHQPTHNPSTWYVAMFPYFPVGLPPLKKTPIKKKCQKGTPPRGGCGGSFLGVFCFLGKTTGKLQLAGVMAKLKDDKKATEDWYASTWSKQELCNFTMICALSLSLMLMASHW